MSGGDLRHADTVRVIVIGAGIAGSAAALAFGRGGHEVVLVDRGAEPSFEGWSADEVFQRWQPPGIAQFRQPHNFLGLGRVVLRDRFSDVYGALHRSGAAEVDQASFRVVRRANPAMQIWRSSPAGARSSTPCCGPRCAGNLG